MSPPTELRVVEHASPTDFLARAGAWLARHEAEHGAFFTICGRIANATATEARAHLLTVEDDGGVTAVALQTPPRKWVVSRSSAAATRALVDYLAAQRWGVPGIIGPVAVARRFAELWIARSGVSARPGKEQRIWELRAVAPLPRVPGHARLATDGDAGTAVAWARGFAIDAVTDETPAQVATLAVDALARGRLHIWEDGEPVAMTAISDATPTGCGVNLVYTPPASRGRGYATALVASVSASLLAAGHRFCFLFTDLANPISNHVYARVGYQPVANWTEYFFA